MDVDEAECSLVETSTPEGSESLLARMGLVLEPEVRGRRILV